MHLKVIWISSAEVRSVSTNYIFVSESNETPNHDTKIIKHKPSPTGQKCDQIFKSRRNFDNETRIISDRFKIYGFRSPVSEVTDRLSLERVKVIGTSLFGGFITCMRYQYVDQWIDLSIDRSCYYIRVIFPWMVMGVGCA